MKQIYHGIVINKSFDDPNFIDRFKLFAKHNSVESDENSWVIYGIEIPRKNIEEETGNIQQNMKSHDPWYVHLYKDEELIVIYKKKIFHITPDTSTWKRAIEYGKNVNIPVHQLTFWPNRFQDEILYFKEEEFIH